MKAEEIKALDDDALLKLSLERGGKYNKYTTDALKAQIEWNRRRGNTLLTHNSNIGGVYIGKNRPLLLFRYVLLKLIERW